MSVSSFTSKPPPPPPRYPPSSAPIRKHPHWEEDEKIVLRNSKGNLTFFGCLWNFQYSAVIVSYTLYIFIWGEWGRWRTRRPLSSWIKGSRTHLVGWSTAGPLALIAEIILPLMTPTYSEISLLKLVLADYLQVLELHLFAILQMWKTLMLGSREEAILIPGITPAVSANRP